MKMTEKKTLFNFKLHMDTLFPEIEDVNIELHTDDITKVRVMAKMLDRVIAICEARENDKK